MEWGIGWWNNREGDRLMVEKGKEMRKCLGKKKN